MNRLAITLQACYPARNVQRFYVLRAGQDLLGDWHVVAHYGRQGQRGQAKAWLCTGEQEAKKKVHHLLQKRLSAEKRIGTNYVVTALDKDPSLPPEWLDEKQVKYTPL